MSEQSITYSDAAGLCVPDEPVIPFIEGDGTGPDIWRATSQVLNAAAAKCFAGKKKIHWLEVLAGEKAYNKTGEWLPENTVETIKKYRVAIKGPLTTPIGGGIRSINVALRQIMNLYSCIRPVQYINGTPSPVKTPELVDMVVFRENTEDVYAGFDWEAGSPIAKKLIEFVEKETKRIINPDSGIGIKPISRTATRRLVIMAIKYAIDHNRKSVTLVHKGNIMKFTEGAFRNWGYEVAEELYKDKIITEDELWKNFNGKMPKGKLLIQDRIADAMFQQILLRPAEYDVLAMPNLNGDYMSDALAAMIGGLGMAPGANIGDGYAVFEATHGTAPKYADQDKINPGSLILSGAMLFDYIGWQSAADAIRSAMSKTISQKTVTYDLARQIPGAHEVKCSEFAQAIIKNL